MSTDGNHSNHRRASSSQLARQWAILRLLEVRDYSVRELADELQSSKSSIQRDIATLQEHFMIVAKSAGQQKRVYRLERHRAPGVLRFTRAELVALEVAIGAVDECAGMPLRTLLCKLRTYSDIEE